ncbi:hypothetical protein J6590_054277 [Homalodisca vitripennis]|nr:hypothetical protein J6590_054277 [Homalodisca vitripennis]
MWLPLVHLDVHLYAEQLFTMSRNNKPRLPVQYQGKWWEQAAYNNERVEGKARCVHTIYSLTPSGNGVVTVENRAIVEKTNKWEGINGTAFEADPSKNEGKLIVSFPVGIFGHVEGPYWVLGTDYNTYTVVYSCQNFLFFWRYYTIWFLGRYQIFPTDEDQADFFRKANQVLEVHNFDPSMMHLSNQMNCNI